MITRLLCLVCLLAFWPLKASHIVGGEMYYSYTGSSGSNNNYRVTFYLFVDCKNGSSSSIEQDKNAYLNVFSKSTSRFNLYKTYALSNARTGPVRVSDFKYSCLKNKPDVCVDKYTYTVDVSLPINANGYVLSYERCCRNSTTVNIQNPGTTGATYWTSIPGSNLVSKDNSPVFKSLPPTFICINAPFTFDNSATDSDGDSLVYELTTPFKGASSNSPIPGPFSATNPANFTNISWLTSSGYNQANQIDGIPKMTINSKTGKLTVVPTKMGQYVIGVKVKEYRNGVLIGESKRDVQFNVISCIFEVVSAFFSPSLLCSEAIVPFQNLSQGGTSFSWDFGDTALNNDTSNLKVPSYAYQNSGNFKVKLIARTSVCADTFEYDVEVKPAFHVKLPKDSIICGPFTEQITASIPNKTYTWNTSDTTQSITINQGGYYSVLVSDPPCYSRDTMFILNDLSTMTLGPDSVICIDQFKPFVFATSNTYKSYHWSNGSDTFFTTINQFGKVDLKTINANGCTFNDTIEFVSYDLPVVQLHDTLMCIGTSKWLNGTNLKTNQLAESKYLWNTGETTATITIYDTGYYHVTVSNRYCKSADTARIDFFITGLDIGLDTFYCGPVSRLLTPLQSYVNYLWQDGSTTSTYLATTPGKKKVTITSVNGCIESDSVLITQYPVLDPGLGNDTTVCISSSVYLTAKSGMSQYLWNTGETGQTIHTLNKGLFYVFVKSPVGCEASDSMRIVADGNALPNEMYMPSAFSPNNDQLNDFYPENQYSSPGADYELNIYNRWGQEIFRSYEVNKQWDGTYNGTECPQDIYLFKIKYRSCDDQLRYFRGTISLMR